MIKEKNYQVVLKDGSSPSIYYPSIELALKSNKGNILRIKEIPLTSPKSKTETLGLIDSGNILLISQRSDEDLDISLECGYAVMYNCPSRNKIFPGMRYLEVSKDKVLEAEIDKLEHYERSIHTRWSKITPRFPDKEWRYVIYHKNGKIRDRKEMEKKYENSLKGTQGGISYIKTTNK
jgi:hypothetical protein